MRGVGDAAFSEDRHAILPSIEEIHEQPLARPSREGEPKARTDFSTAIGSQRGQPSWISSSFQAVSIR